jgi:hypothetical protein
MQTTHAPVIKPSAKLGYVVAVGVNLLMLVVALNILEWGWLGFLTTEFEKVLPWVSLTLVASIIANLVYQFDDGPVVRSLGEMVTNLISILATYRVFRVFPFDFSGYQFDWAPVTRAVLILAMAGAGVGMIAASIRLLSRDDI